MYSVVRLTALVVLLSTQLFAQSGPTGSPKHFSDAKNELPLKSSAGYRTAITGEVEAVEPGEAHTLLRLSESKLSVLIENIHLEKQAGWDLEKFVGKQVFMVGVIDRRKGKLLFLIEERSQIDTDRSKIDWKNGPPLDREKVIKHRKTGKAVSNEALTLGRVPAKIVPLGRTKAECQVQLRYEATTLGGMADDPFAGGKRTRQELRVEKVELAKATAVATPAPGIGAMQIIAPAQRASDDRSNTGYRHAMSDLAYRLEGWPDDFLITVESGGTDKDAQLDVDVIVLLVESLVTGAEIHPDVVHANLERRDTRFTSGPQPSKRELLEMITNKRARPLRLLVEGFGAGELADIARTKDWDVLTKTQFIGYDSDEGCAIAAAADPESVGGKALKGIEETNGVLAKRGFGLIGNPHVQSRVDAALATYPQHLSAQLYRTLGKDGLGNQLSVAGTAEILLNSASRLMKSRYETDRSERGRMYKAIAKDVKVLESQGHPSLKVAVRDCAVALAAVEEAWDAQGGGRTRAVAAYDRAIGSLCEKLREVTDSKIAPPVRAR